MMNSMRGFFFVYYEFSFKDYLLLISISLCLTSMGFAQDVKNAEEFQNSKISLAITHTFVPTAINSTGKKTWLSLPSWGLDYDYRFNSQWGLGLHSDLVIQNFEYEDGDVIRKRTNPLALAGVCIRRLGKHTTAFGGVGAEFSPGEETLALVRLGLDYGVEIPRDWEVSLSMMMDFKIDAYNAFVVGFGIGRKF